MQWLDAKDRQYDSHSIVIQEPYLVIPLSLQGVMSGFVLRSPSQEELENAVQIEMTSPATWNPLDSVFAEYESQLRSMIEIPLVVHDQYVSSLTLSMSQISCTFVHDSFLHSIELQVRISVAQM